MDNAQRALEQGRAMPGTGYGKNASDELGAAADALREAQEQQRQLSREMRQMRDGEDPSRSDGPSGDSRDMRTTELPAPEEFRTPEEYREALLQGMEADVPDEFQALKKRYYEELVHQ
jgi:hypothetical protein